jgi:CPA1 family monovalent cation:H+ antiporter
VALGALLAPPDAVAALAVMRQVAPPHRIRTVLEGESLLNDASSLLIYKLAVAAVATGGFTLSGAAPAFFLVFVGSVVVGWVLAHLTVRIVARIKDAPTATIIQFVTTLGVWLIAEHFALSGVVTVVVFGLTVARRTPFAESARVRIVSFATWETVTFVLNVLAFTLIGLELRPILEVLNATQRGEWLVFAAAILVIVILVRLSWVLLHSAAVQTHDGQIETELALARASALQAAMNVLDRSNDPEAQRLKLEYEAKLAFASVRFRNSATDVAGWVIALAAQAPACRSRSSARSGSSAA